MKIFSVTRIKNRQQPVANCNHHSFSSILYSIDYVRYSTQSLTVSFRHCERLFVIVSCFCACRYPDEEAGEIPMAFVVRKPGGNISGPQVMDYIAKQACFLQIHLFFSASESLISQLRKNIRFPKKQTIEILHTIFCYPK